MSTGDSVQRGILDETISITKKGETILKKISKWLEVKQGFPGSGDWKFLGTAGSRGRWEPPGPEQSSGLGGSSLRLTVLMPG